ncbi:MAG TPA: glutathione S-transferase N-terminal domain-containing protein [Polyangiaceae bacterium]|jgi:GST-like protein|nr:glutathione S-transferase N-terminal domain-containing protein [Polyangiaceae bacterium]
MIDLYTAATPNGFKASIALEELALPYTVHPVNLRNGEQFAPAFLRISPNNKIPAIVDRDAGDQAVFESGAILVYLAEKTGRLLPKAGPGRYAALEWTFFQASHVGPTLGQYHHFANYAVDKLPYAIERFANEAKRVFGVVDKRLGESPYLGGAEYTIADIQNYTWLSGHARVGIDVAQFPHLGRWLQELGARPAVQRGMALPPRDETPMDAKARENLFGKAQFEKR